jgi:hypothetical protein
MAVTGIPASGIIILTAIIIRTPIPILIIIILIIPIPKGIIFIPLTSPGRRVDFIDHRADTQVPSEGAWDIQKVIKATWKHPPVILTGNLDLALILAAGKGWVISAAAGPATGIVNEPRKKPVARLVGQGRNENRSCPGVGPGALGPFFLLGHRRSNDPAGRKTQGRGFPV